MTTDTGPAQRHPADVDHRVVLVKSATHQLVGLADLDDLANAVDQLHDRRVDRVLGGSDGAEHGVAGSGRPVHVVPTFH